MANQKNDITAPLYRNETDPPTFSGRFPQERSFDYVLTPGSGKATVEFRCAPTAETLGKLTFNMDDHSMMLAKNGEGIPDVDGKGYRLHMTGREKAPFKLTREFNMADGDGDGIIDLFQ